MPQQLENLLKIYREELEKVTDDRVKKVILYGSYARGDFRPDSDVDVMVLVDANVDNVSPLERKICDITYDFNNEHETDIMPVVQSKDHFDYWKNADMFYRNVEKEGGSYLNKPESEGTFADVARYKWEQAKDDLETAEIVLDAGKYKAANNRAYYSCYHAIDAVLAMEPIAFKKHKDTLAYFNKNYVNKEIFPREIGRKISRLEVIRHKSDYDTFYIASKEDALEQIEVAREVVELVKDYLVQKGLS